MAKVTAVCILLMQITGTDFDSKSPFMTIATFIAPFVVWYYGLKAKKKELKGKMSFKEGVAEGFKISLFYGIISPFVFLIYYLLVPSVISYVRNAYQMAGASDATVIVTDMVIQFFASIIGGTVYGAIVALFLTRKTQKKK
jgi:hypothetical protein